MQKNVLAILVFFCAIVHAQETNILKRESVLLTIGKPLITSAWSLENNSLVELGYKKTLGKDFAYEMFINRTYSNATKPFFNNNQALIDYLNTTNEIFFNWDKIETYALGAKGHFFFINKPKAEFSFFTGLGVYTSTSEQQSQRSASFRFDNGEITEVETDFKKETTTRAFVMPGLSFRYWVWKKVALGINVITFFEIHDKEVFTVPVQANFYSIALSLSYKL